MATKKCLRTIAFLILLVLATQILASQGRPLKEHTSTQRRELFQGGEATKGMVRHGAVSVSEEVRSSKPMVVVDDIRPTAPGHSPGVGHMLVDEKQREKLIG